MIIIPRNQISLMVTTQITKADAEEATIMFQFDNWSQRGTLRPLETSHEEWLRLARVDAGPVMRKVLLGSVQSGRDVVIQGGGSRVCIHSVFLSPRLHVEVME